MSRLAINTKQPRRITPKNHDKASCFCHNFDFNPETQKDLQEAKEGRIEYIPAKDMEDLFNKLGI